VYRLHSFELFFRVPRARVRWAAVDCFVTILELLRKHPNTGLVYASSSSVYGKDATIPFTEQDCSDHPTNV
jgi:UDP-glucuronate 4-epimerase